VVAPNDYLNKQNSDTTAQFVAKDGIAFEVYFLSFVIIYLLCEPTNTQTQTNTHTHAHTHTNKAQLKLFMQREEENSDHDFLIHIQNTNTHTHIIEIINAT
jgi:hypothetical protein